MKNKTIATLQSIMLRFVLLGVLLFTFTIGDTSAVHAQGGTIRSSGPEGITTNKDRGSIPTSIVDGDDCGEDGDELDSAECHPPVRVTAVWTADGNLNSKTSFVSGEPIQWVITIKNTTGRIASAKLIYDVKDPLGTSIQHSESPVSAAAGESVWPISGVVPSTVGTYSFSGSVKYRDSTTRKMTKYDVNSPCYDLSTSSNPSAGGTVSANPAPDCNSGTQFTKGTVVTLTASANAGYAFSGWSGAVTGVTNPTTVTMTDDKSVVANFVEFTGLTTGIYDDTNPAWSYAGSWSTATNAGYYNGTLHDSLTAGDYASVAMNGSQFILYYTGDTNRGNLDVYVDDHKIDTIDEYSASTVYQNTWTSPVLKPGVHTLKFVHVDGMVVDIDAIEVLDTSSPTAPGAAMLIAPNGIIWTITAAYTWHEVPGSMWYYLWVDGPSGVVIQQWYTSADANCNGTICSVTPTITLSAGSYTWWIQTWNEAGFGPWSNGMTFAPTPPAKATLISPNGSIGTNNPTYTWNEVPGSTWYNLWVEDASGIVIQKSYTASQTNCNGTTCSITPSTTLSAENHTWWVQTWNEVGHGLWSDGMAFAPTPPGKATLTSPSGSIGTNNPIYTWNQVSNATWYYLWVNGPSGVVIQQWYTSADANCNGTTCSVTPSSALVSGAHTWWIQTWNDVGYGSWSDGINFNVP